MYIICPAQTIIEAYASGPILQQNNYPITPQPSPKQHSGTSKVATHSKKSSSSSGQPLGPQEHGGLKAMAHPSLWPTIKSHINTSLALVKNLTDFSQELSQMYEHHAEELQLLVANYRKKNAELRKDRPGANCMMEVWESMLQGVEADSVGHGEVAAVLSMQVSRQTLEKSFYRKLQARKLLQHRESLDTIITKSEDHLAKCRQDYKTAFLAASQSPNSTGALAAYLDAHNTYVTQLHATNAIVDTYAKETLPDILQELDDVYADLCKTMADSLAQGAEILSNRMGSQSRRWCTLWSECKGLDPAGDSVSLIRNSNIPSQPHSSHRLRLFTPPQDYQEQDGVQVGAPTLKNELVTDRLASIQIPQRYDALCEEASQLQLQVQQLQDSLSTMLRLQQRSLESQLFNKANELQEDISKKRYELKAIALNIAANRAQRELFSSKLDMLEGGQPQQDRKMSTASAASMKSKWLKAFKSLKTPPSNGSKETTEKRDTKDLNLADSAHQFQEYTYKKITPCDVCSQVLRGHTRQGLKCRLCKLNVHIDCQEKVGKCHTKSRLLRRQKSSSEIETRVTPPQPTPHSNSDLEQVNYDAPVDSTYHVLKTANELSAGGGGSGSGGGAPPKGQSRRPTTSPHATSSAPHSPRRQKLNLRMKSLSLDSPESTEHSQRRRAGGRDTNTGSAQGSSHSSSSRLQSPSSPVHNRRLLSARNMRMSSVELPDDNEKSSASTSPCPSPVGRNQKPHRLLPTNLYVVLYNFKARHADELDLKPGYKVTVIETSDPDWWRGKCLGRVGFFPSKYVAKLQPGERPLQVTHNLQVAADCTLLRDQIVIQIGEEIDGMVMIRCGDNRQGVCPVKYLQEV